MNLLKTQTIQSIFMSVESILGTVYVVFFSPKDCAKVMLELFEKRLTNWNYHQKLGDVFMKLVFNQIKFANI